MIVVLSAPLYKASFEVLDTISKVVYPKTLHFPISGCYTSTLTLNSKRMFCDQFVMEEWQTIRRLFGVEMVEF